MRGLGGRAWLVVGVLGGTLLSACDPAEAPDDSLGDSGGAGQAIGGVSVGGSGAGGKGSGGVASGGAAASGGSSAAGGARPSDPVHVTLKFRAQVGDELFACGQTYANQGSTGAEATPAFLRSYISNVRLITRTGEERPFFIDESLPWQASGVALLDFEDGSGACSTGDAELRSSVEGVVAPGDYTGLALSTSVPDVLNQQDPATAPGPLQVTSMYWGWGLGYVFFLAEMVGAGTSGGGGAPNGIAALHLGSGTCVKSTTPDGSGGEANVVPCEPANYNDIRLQEFSAADDVIVIDVGALVKNTDLSGTTQCHSTDASCPVFFDEMGLDYATGRRTETQTVFRVGAP